MFLVQSVATCSGIIEHCNAKSYHYLAYILNTVGNFVQKCFALVAGEVPPSDCVSAK